MRIIYFYILCIFPFIIHAQNNFPSIGQWREHLPYQGAVSVCASDNKIYCATPYSLFTIDLATREIDRISKVSGLSETGVSTIQLDPISHKLFIAYTNSNIDVIDAAGIHNAPDIKRSSISGDKNIYQIYPDDQFAYLSTGIGILVFDAIKYEIKDSWFIGNNGDFVKTYGCTKTNGLFYAATEEGLKSASVTNNLADFHNWQLLSGSNGLSASRCKAVVTLQNTVIALQNDSLFQLINNSWVYFFSNGLSINSINVSNDQLFVSQQLNTADGQMLIVNLQGNIIRTIRQAGVISFPRNGIFKNNEYWVADLYGGLSEWTGNNFEQYKLNSPQDIGTGQISTYNNVLYATAGSVNEAWNYLYDRSGIFKLSNGIWVNYNQYTFPQLDSVMDFITIAIDPRDQSAWAGSFGGGLVHIKNDNQLVIYKQYSIIQPTVGDPSSYRIAGLAFDNDNNLWISNFGSDHELVVLKNDSTWLSFAAPFYLSVNAAADIVIDNADQKWILSPPGNGVLVYNQGKSIDNPSDDRWKLYTTGVGQGNLPGNIVTAIAKDKNDFIWVGTNNGIGVIECPDQAFSNGCDAVWPVILESGFANYLFNGQYIQNIAVDGADRKWVATTNGAFLLSPAGDKLLLQFNEENSPLLSSDVKKITVNGTTGEVFFATSKGMCSYRGTATEISPNQPEEVLIFPNPVPPSYNGTIGIKGVPDNSIVKILETNGRLVYQTRSLGGQAIWNGKDYKGRQVSSGVYLVIAEDDNKQQKVVGKIVFISK